MSGTRVVRIDGSAAPISEGSVVTIGAYDGVHLGHRKVLQLVRELADARGLDAVCVTFDRHPAQVVRPETAPNLLTSLDHKLELLVAADLVDIVCVLEFDEGRSQGDRRGLRARGARRVARGAAGGGRLRLPLRASPRRQRCPAATDGGRPRVRGDRPRARRARVRRRPRAVLLHPGSPPPRGGRRRRRGRVARSTARGARSW